jgi:hypothetical protein
LPVAVGVSLAVCGQCGARLRKSASAALSSFVFGTQALVQIDFNLVGQRRKAISQVPRQGYQPFGMVGHALRQENEKPAQHGIRFLCLN